MLWKNVEQYYLTITKEFHGLCLREVIIGITMSKCPLLNYLILIGKLYLWDCRKKQVLPNIEGFKFKVRIKYQVEKYISIKNNKLETFYEKMAKRHLPRLIKFVCMYPYETCSAVQRHKIAAK